MLDGTSDVTNDARGAPNDVRSGARVQLRARLQQVLLPAQLSNSTGLGDVTRAQPSRELKPGERRRSPVCGGAPVRVVVIVRLVVAVACRCPVALELTLAPPRCATW